MRLRNSLIGAALALGTITDASAAQEIVITRTPAPSATVSLAGLNLNSRAGIATAKARVEKAAAGLCLTKSVEPVDMRMARAQCYRAAVADGHRKLDRTGQAPRVKEVSGGASLTIVAR
jgi:UrcA family protein